MFVPSVGNGVEMGASSVHVIHAIVQLHCLIPVIDAGPCVKTVIAGGFGRKFYVGFGGTAVKIDIAFQFCAGNVIKVIIRAEC